MISRRGVRLKTLALPTEHGGWGITLEPVVLGLLVAPTVAAFVTFVLLARAAYGFARRWPSTAKRVGFAEIAFGALTVAAAAVGVALGL